VETGRVTLRAVEELVPQGQTARRLLPFMAGLSAFGLLVLASSFALRLSARTEGYGGTLFAVGSIGVLYLWLWIRNARLLVGQGVIGQRNLVGRTTTLFTSDIGNMVIATVLYSRNGTPQRALYVLSLDGRQLMALNTQAWGDEAIGKVVEASGKDVEYRDGTISAKAFKAEFPHAVSWAARHTTLLGALIVVVAFGLALGIPIGLVLMHR
jgi:hypothetical protein